MAGRDACSRCRGHVTHVVTYQSATARWVERMCEKDAKALRKQHGRKVTVSPVAKEFQT